MNNMLEVRNLCKTYGDFSLNDVSFSLPNGTIMGFVGENGAGKTTTIRCILNMAMRDSGEIQVFGLDNIHDEIAVKQGIAAVFDEICFVDTWRVREVEQAIHSFYDEWSTESFSRYLTQFGLPKEKRVKELSRGMKMKLMLAVAMSHNAKLLILDEPTSGLDPVARDELLTILQQYIADGEKSVFFSTHITSDLERVADFITLIDKGRIVFADTKETLLENFRILKGDIQQLSDDLRGKLIGLTITAASFSAMLRTQDMASVTSSGTFVYRQPSIDEILVYISKEEDNV